MREIIREKVKSASTLKEVRDELFGVFDNLRSQGYKRIGYVSGIITSEGPENIPGNIERLDKFTQVIRKQKDFPIFSATDVFDNNLFEKLDAAGFKNTDWEVFWRQVLGSKKRYITDIFMTPKWEISSGATDEHETAKEKGMNIEYLKEELQ